MSTLLQAAASVDLTAPSTPIGSVTPVAVTTTQLNVTDGFTIKGVTSTTTGIGIGQIAGGWFSITCAGVRVIDFNASALNSAGNLPWTGGLHTIGVSGVSFAPSCDGTTFADITSVSTTHTDGTEDDLFSHSMQAGCLNANGASIEMWEHVQTVGSATATRRIKKYFGGTLIYDSGVLTTATAADLSILTRVIRVSSTVVRCDVAVTSGTATVTSSTYTAITGLTLSNAQILKTTGIAAGTGAASGDIIDLIEKTNWSPASPSVT